MLVVSELVSNAVLHGGGRVAVEVRCEAGEVTIGAYDGSRTRPRHRQPDDRGGRGLTIVEALVTGWGVHDDGRGKRVWARLTPHPA